MSARPRIVPATPPVLVLPQEMRTVPIDSILPSPENINEGDVGAITASMDANGFFGSVLVQASTHHIIAGEHRWLAAKRLGATEIPVTFVSVDDDRARRIRLADNRTARLASMNSQSLADLLTDLADTEDGLAGTGFSGDDLDELLSDLAHLSSPPAPQAPTFLGDPDALPEPPASPITKPGDVIRLGDHRLICGDCRDATTVERLLDGRAINVAFTSPPYADQRDYDKTSGFVPVPADAYVDWYADAAARIKEHLASDGSYFLNIKEHTADGQRVLYVKDLTLAHVRAWGWLFLDEFCWQHQGFPGAYVGRFKNEWEPVFHYALQGGAGLAFNTPASDFPYNPHMDIFLGPAGGGVRGGATVGGSIPGVGDDPQARPGNVVRIHNSGAHGYKAGGASFPVALPTFFIDAFSRPGDVIYDPFLGSGATLIAAHTAGRVGYGCEISPAYCDVIVQRWQETTGETAVRP